MWKSYHALSSRSFRMKFLVGGSVLFLLFQMLILGIANTNLGKGWNEFVTLLFYGAFIGADEIVFGNMFARGKRSYGFLMLSPQGKRTLRRGVLGELLTFLIMAMLLLFAVELIKERMGINDGIYARGAVFAAGDALLIYFVTVLALNLKALARSEVVRVLLLLPEIGIVILLANLYWQMPWIIGIMVAVGDILLTVSYLLQIERSWKEAFLDA